MNLCTKLKDLFGSGTFAMWSLDYDVADFLGGARLRDPLFNTGLYLESLQEP